MRVHIFFLTAVVTMIAGSALATETDQPSVTSAKPTAQATPSKPAPTQVPAESTSPPDHIIFEDLGKHYCVGNVLCPEHCAKPDQGCEVKAVYTQKLDQPSRISRIQLYAHDNVGLTRRTDLLLVKVDGRDLGRFPVYRAGSTISVPVNRNGQLITIEAMYNRNGLLLGGEQTVIAEGAVISDIYVFGRDAR